MIDVVATASASASAPARPLCRGEGLHNIYFLSIAEPGCTSRFILADAAMYRYGTVRQARFEHRLAAACYVEVQVQVQPKRQETILSI